MDKFWIVILAMFILLAIFIATAKPDTFLPYVRADRSFIDDTLSEGYGTIDFRNTANFNITVEFSSPSPSIIIVNPKNDFQPYSNFTLYFFVNNQTVRNFIFVNDTTDNYFSVIPVSIDVVKQDCLRKTMIAFGTNQIDSGISQFLYCGLSTGWRVSWTKNSVLQNDTNNTITQQTTSDGFILPKWIFFMLIIGLFVLFKLKDFRKKPVKWLAFTLILAILLLLILFLLPTG
jgi:hypothetical protein